MSVSVAVTSGGSDGRRAVMTGGDWSAGSNGVSGG